MKLVTYELDGAVASGVLDKGSIYPFTGGQRLIDVIAGGQRAVLETGLEAFGDSAPVDMQRVRLLPPVDPPQLRDSMCFHEHIRNGVGEVDPKHLQFPVFYFSNAAGVIGPHEDVPISPGSERFDYELEVAAVIGREASNIAPSQAVEHIAGYTMYIDWSARDLQFNEMSLRLGPAKGKDGATTLGPVLVTPDELEPYRSGKGFDLAMTVRINDEPVSSGNWSTINWAFDDVLAYTSRGTTLRTGDVLGSGTVGLGCLLEHYRRDRDDFRGWLQPGDVVTFEVERIGTLRQRVVAAPELHRLSSGF